MNGRILKHITKSGYRGFYRGLIGDLLKTCPTDSMYFLCISYRKIYYYRKKLKCLE